MDTDLTIAATGWSTPTGGPVQQAGCEVCPRVLHGSVAAAELELNWRAARARMYNKEHRSSAPCVRRRGDTEARGTQDFPRREFSWRHLFQPRGLSPWKARGFASISNNYYKLFSLKQYSQLLTVINSYKQLFADTRSYLQLFVVICILDKWAR